MKIISNSQPSLQGFQHETLQSKIKRFRAGKFISIGSDLFISVPKLWNSIRSVPAISKSLSNNLDLHKNDKPWSIPFSVNDIISILLSIKAKRDWSSDEVFNKIDFDRDILPSISGLGIEKHLTSVPNQKIHLISIEKEFIERLRHVFKADLSYPIIINNADKILDGNHRLIQCAVRDHCSIQTKRYTHISHRKSIFILIVKNGNPH